MEEFGLKATIDALRKELSESVREAQGKDILFEVGDINLEFEVVISKDTSKDAKAGFKFTLLPWGGEASASIERKDSNSSRQKMTIQLKPGDNSKPRDADGNMASLMTSGGDVRRDEQ